MDLSAMFSDDQIAVMGCFAALVGCGLIAMLSFQFGSAGKVSQQTAGKTLPFASKAPTETSTDSRKAA